MLTQSNEILIYVEHHGITHVHELNKWRKSSLRGVLGKLEALKLIERPSDKSIKITDKGISYIDNMLENLHADFDKWQNDWQCVLFGIPESMRPKRDRLRRYLKSNGYNNIFKTVWIKPVNEPDEMLVKYIDSEGIGDSSILVTFKSDNTLSKKLLSNWPLSNTKKQYLSFITNAKKLIKPAKKNAVTAYDVKKTIFELATILDEDPKLPSRSMPTDWPREEALSLYKKLKQLLAS